MSMLYPQLVSFSQFYGCNVQCSLSDAFVKVSLLCRVTQETQLQVRPLENLETSVLPRWTTAFLTAK